MAIEVFHEATVYVDESLRTDRETGEWLCCVTAYIGSFEAWIQAELEWQRVLDHFGVSAFHLKDFLGRQKEFKNDWPDSKRNDFMERFCTIASQRPIMGVGCAITQKDWAGGFSEKLRAEWRDPYNFCIYGMLSLIRTKVMRDRTVLPLPLCFLFDNKPKFEGAARKLYREYQSAHDPSGEIFDGVDFGSHKKYKGLQVADLLVGVINRRFEEMTHGVGPELSKMKKPMDLLFKKEIAIAFPRAELIQEFVGFAQREPLQI